MTKYVLVPIAPTDEMIKSAAVHGNEEEAEVLKRIWSAMLAAAPQDNISGEKTDYWDEFRVLKPEHPDYREPVARVRIPVAEWEDRIQHISPKPGDFIAIRYDGFPSADAVEQAKYLLGKLSDGVSIMFMSLNMQIELLDEDSMRRNGWVRAK